MRVATWNLGFWQYQASHRKAWDYLRNTIKPDVAMLQEVSPPEPHKNEHLLFRPVHGNWGTALYSRGIPLRALTFHTHAERVAAAEIRLETGQDIIAASIHAPIINQHVFPYLDRIFDELEDLVADKTFIIGGDLNAAKLAEKVWPGYGHGPFFDRITHSKFVDCVHKFYAEEPQTVFRPGQRYAFQDDHLFVSHDLIEKAESCTVLNNAVTRAVSDHIPVTVEINLQPSGASRW